MRNISSLLIFISLSRDRSFRSMPKIGHDLAKQPVTIDRNHWSRLSEMTGHDGPKYALRQHSGKNNGHLHLSFSWLARRSWKSRDVIQRAKAELTERNLLLQTRQGGLNIGASRYAVTWLHISNFAGLDIQSKDYRPSAWAFMDKLPMGKKIANAIPPDGKGNTGKRYSAIPPTGTAKCLTVP